MKISNQRGVAHVALIVVLVLVALIVVGVGVYTQLSNKDDSAKIQTSSSSGQSTETQDDKDKAEIKISAKEHFSLVYGKNFEKAYDVTCQGFKDLMSFDRFQDQIEAGNFTTVDLSAVEYTEIEVRNNQAKAGGEIGPLSPDTKLQVSFLKENGSWCVYGYETEKTN